MWLLQACCASTISHLVEHQIPFAKAPGFPPGAADLQKSAYLAYLFFFISFFFQRSPKAAFGLPLTPVLSRTFPIVGRGQKQDGSNSAETLGVCFKVIQNIFMIQLPFYHMGACPAPSHKDMLSLRKHFSWQHQHLSRGYKKQATYSLPGHNGKGTGEN